MGELSKADFQDLRYRDPESAADFEEPFEIHSELSDLIDSELEKHPDVGP